MTGTYGQWSRSTAAGVSPPPRQSTQRKLRQLARKGFRPACWCETRANQTPRSSAVSYCVGTSARYRLRVGWPWPREGKKGQVLFLSVSFSHSYLFSQPPDNHGHRGSHSNSCQSLALRCPLFLLLLFLALAALAIVVLRGRVGRNFCLRGPESIRQSFPPPGPSSHQQLFLFANIFPQACRASPSAALVIRRVLGIFSPFLPLSLDVPAFFSTLRLSACAVAPSFSPAAEPVWLTLAFTSHSLTLYTRPPPDTDNTSSLPLHIKTQPYMTGLIRQHGS